jgi:sugar diacid utilization regulator
VFYANTGSCAQCPRIFGEVVLDNSVQGHVMVFLGDIPLREEDTKIVELLIDAICIKIQSQTKGMSRWNLSLTTKLQNLLDTETPPHLMKLSCEAISAAVVPEYVVIATPVGQKASQRAFAEYAVSQLHQMYRHIIAAIYDNCIVTLVGEARRRSSNGNLTPASAGFVQEILDYFSEHDMVSGVSNCFSDLTMTRPHYRQAVLAAQMALRLELGSQQFFMDLMPLPMFLSVLEHEQPETFIHPAVFAMRDYDAEHGTEYYATMRAFSMTMHNKDQTAAVLRIHRNTLLYRLGRISELFELAYEEEQISLNVLCSYLILELQEHATKEQMAALFRSDKT